MIGRIGRLGGARRAGLALLLIGGMAGATSGCATAARYPVAERSVKAPARIRNLSLSEVRVYLEQGGVTRLIGSVPALSSARLAIPDAFARRGTRLGLSVAPAGRGGVGQRVLVGDVRVEDLTTRGWTVVDSAF
jgi:hypothetical protein